MLAGADVIDLMWQARTGLGQQAVLTTPVGSLLNLAATQLGHKSALVGSFLQREPGLGVQEINELADERR